MTEPKWNDPATVPARVLYTFPRGDRPGGPPSTVLRVEGIDGPHIIHIPTSDLITAPALDGAA